MAKENNAADAAFTFVEDKDYDFKVVGFTFTKDWTFFVVETPNGKERILAGSRDEWPYQLAREVKGNNIGATYRGVRNVEGKDYHRFNNLIF